MVIEPSESESARFGLKVGRVTLDESCNARELQSVVAPFDFVVARFDSAARQIPAELTRIASHTSFSADTLVYWEWVGDGVELENRLPGGMAFADEVDEGPLDDLVGAVFASYSNHYNANPILSSETAVVGYREWVQNLVSLSHISCSVLVGEDGTYLGFGLVDWSGQAPDIRLAGMHPAEQGRGLYSHLVREILQSALQRGHQRVVISTQVDNIAVTRAWARLGFLPHGALSTHHLVRNGLFDVNR